MNGPAATFCTLVAAAVAANAAAASEAITFNREVAPILFKNCINCHRPGGSAPGVSLISFADAKPWAASIKQQVLRREMPPWPADPQRSVKFRNDPRLSQQDIATLAAWVDAEAPQGDTPPPAVPATLKGWLHPGGAKPDAVIALPEFTVPASGEIPYVIRRVPVPLTEDKWIVAMQVRPGNEALVHHMGITEIVASRGITLARNHARTG